MREPTLARLDTRTAPRLSPVAAAHAAVRTTAVVAGLACLLPLAGCGGAERDAGAGSAHGGERAGASAASSASAAAPGSAATTPAAAAVAMPVPQRILGIGRIEPEGRFVDLASEVSGVVAALIAAPGDSVRPGDEIVRLTDEIERARLAQAEARLRSQRAVVPAKRAALAAQQALAENARRQYERVQALHAAGVETQSGLDDAEATSTAAREQATRLAAELEAEAALLEQAEADRRLAEAEWRRRAIRAQSAGRVLALDIGVGQFVVAGTPFGTLAVAGASCARCEVDELFADALRPGQRAIVRAEGAADTLAAGMVIEVGPWLRRKSLFADQVGDLEDRRVREIVLRLDGESVPLLGRRVECVIETGASGTE